MMLLPVVVLAVAVVVVMVGPTAAPGCEANAAPPPSPLLLRAAPLPQPQLATAPNAPSVPRGRPAPCLPSRSPRTGVFDGLMRSGSPPSKLPLVLSAAVAESPSLNSMNAMRVGCTASPSSLSRVMVPAGVAVTTTGHVDLITSS